MSGTTTFPVDHQGLHQRVQLPEVLVCGLHLLQLLLEPLQRDTERCLHLLAIQRTIGDGTNTFPNLFSSRESCR